MHVPCPILPGFFQTLTWLAGGSPVADTTGHELLFSSSTLLLVYLSPASYTAKFDYEFGQYHLLVSVRILLGQIRSREPGNLHLGLRAYTGKRNRRSERLDYRAMTQKSKWKRQAILTRHLQSPALFGVEDTGADPKAERRGSQLLDGATKEHKLLLVH